MTGKTNIDNISHQPLLLMSCILRILTATAGQKIINVYIILKPIVSVNPRLESINKAKIVKIYDVGFCRMTDRESPEYIQNFP